LPEPGPLPRPEPAPGPTAQQNTIQEKATTAKKPVRRQTIAEKPAPAPAAKTALAEKPKPAPAEKPKSKRGRKSLKEVAAEASLINIPEDEVLFSKQYYTMGEVAEMFHVNQSLLRFWETEFSILQPRKNKKGDRYFRPIDIKNLHLIYHLLRQRKYTIEGAKEFLRKNKTADQRFEAIQRLQQIKAFLLELKAQL
jgi:DNA-binding transcriptional MerR regulator